MVKRGPIGAALLLALATGCAPARVARFEPYPEAEVAGVRDVHAFRGKPLCQACHVAGGGLKADPVALCGGCHKFRLHNHSVNVVPKVKVVGVPLWEGKVSCHSCHDPHDVKKNRKGLRYASDDELCLKCHMRH